MVSTEQVYEQLYGKKPPKDFKWETMDELDGFNPFANVNEHLDKLIQSGREKASHNYAMAADSSEYYFYKGNIYKKIDEITTKNPSTGEWEPYVLYQNAKGQLFSREINDFYKKFSEVKDDAVAVSKFKTIGGLQ